MIAESKLTRIIQKYPEILIGSLIGGLIAFIDLSLDYLFEHSAMNISEYLFEHSKHWIPNLLVDFIVILLSVLLGYFWWRAGSRYRELSRLESDAKFRSLFDSIPDPIYLFEQRPNDTVIIAQVNKATTELTRGKIVEFLGKDLNLLAENAEFSKRMHWIGIDLKEIEITVNALIETGKTLRIEQPFRQPSGNLRWFILLIMPRHCSALFC